MKIIWYGFHGSWWKWWGLARNGDGQRVFDLGPVTVKAV